MKEIIRQTFSLLDPRQQKKGSVVVALLVFQSFLDFFNVASFLPIVFLIINPDFIESNTILSSIYTSFGFSSHNHFIITITVAVLVFTLIKVAISYWITLIKARYAFGVSTELAERATTRYLESGYPGFSDADFSREVTRITRHPVTFANGLLLPIANLLSESLVFSFLLVCVLVYDVKIMMLLVVILLPVAFIYQMLKKNTRSIGEVIREKYPLLLKYAQQITEALIEIKTHATEVFFARRFRQVNEELSRVFTLDHVIQSSTIRMTEVVAAMVICVLVIYTVLTGQSYQQSILMLSIYAGASFRMIPSINRILLALFQIRSHAFVAQDLKDLVNFNPALTPATRADTCVLSDQLILNNISFSYTNQNSVLQNVNLTLRRGTKVALTGKSGEGKTTLLLILLGFLKDYTGEIRLDNNVIDGSSLRRIMGYVPQNPYILDGTLAQNVAFGIPEKEIDRAKILGLINRLDLRKLVEQLPQGIDSRIGEKGAKLSGGQRQRIALARALYTDADILLIDEATSQVHDSLELEILKLLDTLKTTGKIIVVITHKLSAQTSYDSIYKLESGNLTEAVRSEIT